MKKALIGFGGHAREVMVQMGIKLTCFVDDDFVTEDSLPLSSFDPKEFAVMVAISNSQNRNDIVNRLPRETKYFTFIHPTAQLMDNNIICNGNSSSCSHGITG